MNPRSPGLVLLLTLMLGVFGCGTERAPRVTQGTIKALRTLQAIPPHGRLKASDVEEVALDATVLPAPQDLPRRAAEVLGAAALDSIPAGTFLRDDHLELHPILPDPGANYLADGELGWMANIKGLPLDIPVGACLAFEGVVGGFRLAAISPPEPGARSCLLAGPEAEVLAAIRSGIPDRLILAAAPVSCAPPAPKPPPTPAREVRVARKFVRRGTPLSPDMLERHSLPAGIGPQGAPPATFTGPTRPVLHDLAAGQVVTPGAVAPDPKPAERPPAVTLHVPGLHPDWLHPDSVAFYVRSLPGATPLPVRVEDLERSTAGAPVPIKARPLEGFEWPKSRAKRASEGGVRRWMLLLKR